MPRLAPVSDEQATETTKEIFRTLQGKMGRVINIFRTMAHAPEVLQATLQQSQAIQQHLDAKLRELAYLRTSELNDCHY